MQKVLAGLPTELSPKAREQDALRDELDQIISRLQQQQVELQKRLADHAGGVQKRRLRIALEVAQLQQKKARALRQQLPQF